MVQLLIDRLNGLVIPDQMPEPLIQSIHAFSEVKTYGYPILSTSESLNKNEYKVSVSTSSFQDEITKEYIVNFNEPYKGIQEI